MNRRLSGTATTECDISAARRSTRAAFPALGKKVAPQSDICLRHRLTYHDLRRRYANPHMNTPNQPESSEIVSVDDTIDAIAREALTEARRMAVRSPVDSLTTRPDYTPTPDRRYYVLKGRLWRLSNPGLNQKTHQQLVAQLIAAKREVREGKDSIHRIAARLNADKAKRALGERGEVWWTDGAPDYHRCLVINTPYASWFMGSE